MEWILPVIEKQKCVVCAECVDICPTDALGLQEGEIVFLHPHKCTFCTLCEQICSYGAIRCEFSITRNNEVKN